MTAAEIRAEIQKVLGQLPEDVLPDVLNFLKKLEAKLSEKIIHDKLMDKILTEDEELLKRLAK